MGPIKTLKAVGRKNRVAVVNIVAPDFNPGIDEKHATRPHEKARKSKYQISDGMAYVLKKTISFAPDKIGTSRSALANGHENNESN